MSMAHGREVRVPFLDHDFLEHVLALQDTVRAPGATRRSFLVEALDGLIIPAIANRTKAGFAMLFEAWIRGPLKLKCDTTTNWLNSQAAFDLASVRGVARLFQDGDQAVPFARALLLVSLGAWLERNAIL